MITREQRLHFDTIDIGQRRRDDATEIDGCDALVLCDWDGWLHYCMVRISEPKTHTIVR